MKARIITCFIIIIIMFSSCTYKKSTYQDAVRQYSADMLQITENSMQMQRKLAKWYNLNLHSEKPDVGFERAYDRILCFTDGMIGYVEIPDMDIQVPIYHDIRTDGFYLNPYSSFPTGGQGNCTELHTQISLLLSEGDIFWVHVLNDMLIYQIGGTGNDRCILICGDAIYEGVRIVED